MDKLFRPYAGQLQVRMELPSVGMIKSFVAAGLGVSLISTSFARDQVLAGRVRLIPPKEKELWRELAIAYRRDRTLTRASVAVPCLNIRLHGPATLDAEQPWRPCVFGGAVKSKGGER